MITYFVLTMITTLAQAYKVCEDYDSSESASPRPVTSKGSMELKLGSPHTVTAVVSDDDESSSDERGPSAHSAASTAAAAKAARTTSQMSGGQRPRSSAPIDARSDRTGARTNANPLPVATSSWLSSWVCASTPPQQQQQRGSEKQLADGSAPTARGRFSQASSSFLGDVEAYLRKITTDPEFQFAGII